MDSTEQERTYSMFINLTKAVSAGTVLVLAGMAVFLL